MVEVFAFSFFGKFLLLPLFLLLLLTLHFSQAASRCLAAASALIPRTWNRLQVASGRLQVNSGVSVCVRGSSEALGRLDQVAGATDAAAWAVLGDCWLCKPRVTGGLP
jgi:hypothetical protein